MERQVVIEEIADPTNARRMIPRRRVTNASVLDMYRNRNCLDPTDRAENFNRWWAGTTLAQQLAQLNTSPKLISRYEEWIGRGSVEGFFAKRGDIGKEVDAALDYVGNTGRNVVISACWLDEPVGRDRLPVLREALHQLYRFYEKRTRRT